MQSYFGTDIQDIQFQFQEQTKYFRRSMVKWRRVRSFSETEIQTVGRQRSSPEHYIDTNDPPQTQMTLLLLWSWPRHTGTKAFKRNLRVDNACPSPADVSRNTLERSAAFSEMTLCWPGPKIHRHEWTTGRSAHCLGGYELERGKFPGLCEMNWSLRCSLHSCKQVQFQLKVFNILLCLVPLLNPTLRLIRCWKPSYKCEEAWTTSTWLLSENWLSCYQ